MHVSMIRSSTFLIESMRSARAGWSRFEMHEALNEENTAKLESLPIEDQAIMLWKTVQKGVIDVDLTDGSRR